MRWLGRAAVAIALFGLGLAAWGFLIEPGLLRITEVKVETEKWPASHPPLRIAVIGDIHAGAPHVDLAYLEDLVDEANAVAPDLTLLLGDYVIHGVLFGDFIEPSETAKRLARLQAPLGVYAILGNHDWWLDGEAIARELEAVGISVLENKALPIATEAGGFWIAGIADDSTSTPDPDGTLASVPPDAPVVAMAHDPATFPDMPARVAITFAGHTHGGQVYLPFIGALAVPGRAPLRHAYGLIREDGKDLYVTSGIGTSILPLRLNMPPEIALVTLRSNAKGLRVGSLEGP